MTINIGYLYYDLLNLYGEIGNIKIIKYQLEKQNIKVNIDKVTLEDNININKYDLIYLGSGTEKNIETVYQNIKQYKDDLKNYIKDNKFILVTGNAIDLLTKDHLNLYDIDIKDKEKRYVEELNITNNYIKDNIIGLTNRYGYIKNTKNPLYEDKGIKDNNLYATSLIGPIMVKNPLFLEYFLKELIKSKDKKFKFKKFDLELEKKAYKEFIKFKEQKINKFKE